MKHFRPRLYGSACAAATVTGHAQTSPPPAPVQRFTHGLFQDVPVHRPAGAAQQFALLLVEGKAASEAEQALRRSMLARGAVVAEVGLADDCRSALPMHGGPARRWRCGRRRC